jgi:hypothetical protein
MRKGGLERGWKVTDIDFPVCSGKATSFVSSKDVSFNICQHCAVPHEIPALAEREPLENRIDH